MRAAFFAISDTSTGNVVAASANAAPKKCSHANQSADTVTLTGNAAVFLVIAAAGAGNVCAWFADGIAAHANICAGKTVTG